MDSMKLARRYTELGMAIFDLKRELWSRSTDTIIRDAPLPSVMPQGAPPGILPEPEPHEIEPPSAADVTLDTTSSARGLRSKISVSYASDTQVDPGLNRWLARAGFKVSSPLSGQDSANVIVFGDSVPLPDVKALALQMMHLGLRPRSIRLFESGNEFAIQLKNLKHLDTAPPLSVENVRALRLPAATDSTK